MKKNINSKNQRQARVRKKLRQKSQYPRLNVFRSNSNISAQIINDKLGKTLAAVSANQLKLDTSKKTKTQLAEAVGELIAKKAIKAKITHVVFDRGGYKYHGRIAALAKAARKAGLKF